MDGSTASATAAANPYTRENYYGSGRARQGEGQGQGQRAAEEMAETDTRSMPATTANMFAIDGFPALQFQVLGARRDTTVGGGDAETSWHARLRYTPPTALAKGGDVQIECIDFLATGSELNSERHDRESHTVTATLSPTGEQLTLYDSSYYEKYSSMQNGPGNAKDASDAGREKLAAYLSSLDHSPGAGSSPFISAAGVLTLARALDSRAAAGSLPGTVKTHVKGPDDDGRYDNCAQS